MANVAATLRARYWALSALGLGLVGWQTARGHYATGDFWEHAAAVRELARHTADPGNPVLATGDPHAFLSPYALGVALVVKVTSLHHVDVLAAAGLLNYALLCAGLWRFVRVFTTAPAAPFYALLFTFLLWGWHPWQYSGFLHLRELGYVACYPSTFALAVALLTAAGADGTLRAAGRRRATGAALTVLGVTVVVLTHPIAAVVLLAALAAVGLTAPDRARAIALLAGSAAAGGLLGLAWPYYPPVDLLGEQGVYDPSNRVMYEDWLLRTFPALAVIAVLVWPTPTLNRARLGIYTAVLAAVFAYGWVSGHWSAGRVIAYLVLGAHIGLADLASRLEARWRPALRGRRAAFAAGAAALALGVALLNMAAGFRGTLPGTGDPVPTDHSDHVAAARATPAGSVVLAPVSYGVEVIPVHGGRLVAAQRPLAFVADADDRRRAAGAFYDATTTAGRRRALLRRYRVDYVVVPAGARPGAFAPLGPVVRRTPGFDVRRIRSR